MMQAAFEIAGRALAEHRDVLAARQGLLDTAEMFARRALHPSNAGTEREAQIREAVAVGVLAAEAVLLVN